MLKLESNFLYQDNPIKFGQKFDSTPVSARFYSNGLTEVISKGITIYSFSASQIKEIQSFRTKQGNDLSGIELYFPSKVILLRSQEPETVLKWKSNLIIMNNTSKVEKLLTINLFQRKGMGLTNEYEACTIQADKWRYTIYNDCDCAVFRYNYPYLGIKKVVFQEGPPSRPYLLIVYLMDGKELYYSHNSEDILMELFNFFKIYCLK